MAETAAAVEWLEKLPSLERKKSHHTKSIRTFVF